MNRTTSLALLIALGLMNPVQTQADPEILSLDRGTLTWSNSATFGYHAVEWATTATGTWQRSWQTLVDIPAIPGVDQRDTPLFFRVVWNATPIAPTNGSTALVPDVSSFSATGGDGFIGLLWTMPVATNAVGLRVVRNALWYPLTPYDGSLVFQGLAAGTIDAPVSNGQRYYYRAFTHDGGGNYSLGAAATAQAADATAPPDVQGLQVMAGDHQVALSWANPPTNDLAGVRVVRSTTAPPNGPSAGSVVYSGSGTSVLDVALGNGTTVYYRVFAFDLGPNYSFGVPAMATPQNFLPPDPITNLSLTWGDQRLVLAWTNPVGKDFQGVRVQLKAGSPPSGVNDGQTVLNGVGSSVTSTGLTNNVVYHYALFTFDEVPNYSPAAITSGVPADAIAPANVTALSAQAVTGGILLAWANPTDGDFAGMRIQRTGSGYPAGPLDGTTIYTGTGTNFLDTPLAGVGSTNFYRVFAFDEVPNYSSGASVPFAAPPPVTSFSIAITDTAVRLSWNPPNTNLYRVMLLSKTGTPPTGPLDGVLIYQGTSGSFTNEGLNNGTLYHFAAITVDATPNFSTAVAGSAVPADVTGPAPPSFFAATAITGGVRLAWTNPVDADLMGVRIQVKTGGHPTNFADGTTVYQGAGTAATDAVGLVSGYLTNYYRIFAFDEVPNYSPATSALLAPLPPVTSLTALPTNGAAILRWTNPSSNSFAGVRIQRTTASPPASVTDGTTVYQGSGTSMTNSGLTNRIVYYYGVFAHDAAPHYSQPAIINVTPADIYPPGNISTTVSESVDQGTHIEWLPPADSDYAGTRIVRKMAVAPTNISDGILVYTGAGTSFDDSGLINGSNYYYRCYAFDAYSNYASGVTVSNVPSVALFSTSFEAVDGWDLHSSNTWADADAAGEWSGSYMFVSNSAQFARTGQNYARYYSFTGYLFLPPVDNFCEVTLWVRSPGFASGGSVQVDYFDGLFWQSLASQSFFGDVYKFIRFQRPFIGRLQTMIRIQCDDTCCIDDITVRSAP